LVGGPQGRHASFLAFGVQGYLVSVWVGECEGPPEWPVKGLGHDRDPIVSERVVDLLGVGRMQPHRDAFPGLLDGVQIDSGQWIANGECDRRDQAYVKTLTNVKTLT
jgi:hypothetical protein